jgi:hypothetical protein
MSIDLHDSVSAGQNVARRARRRARKTVKAARAIDVNVPEIHVPDLHVSPKVAKRAAKKAATRAAAIAGRKAARSAKRAGKHAVRRVIIVAVVAGTCAAVAVIVCKRLRDESSPVAMGAAPDPFGAAVGETDRLGRALGSDGEDPHEHTPAAGV